MITNIKTIINSFKENNKNEYPIYYTDRNGYLQWGKIVNVYENSNRVNGDYNYSLKFIIRNKLDTQSIVYLKSFTSKEKLDEINWDFILSDDKIEHHNY